MPIVLNIIDNSKKESIIISAENYKKALEMEITRINLENEFNPQECNIQGKNKLICDDKEIILKVSGDIPTKGKLIIEDRKVISFDIYYNENNKVSYFNGKYLYNKKSLIIKSNENTLELDNNKALTLKNYKISYNPKLPNEYQEVEYIESTGTQYIGLGEVTKKGLFTYEIKAQYTSISSEGCILGAGSGGFELFSSPSRNSKVCLYQNGQTSATLVSDYDATNIFTATVTSESSGNNFIVNNMPYTKELKKNANRNISLFSYEGSSYFSKSKVYSLKFSSQGIIYLNFIPCYRKSDSELGMYDLVNNEFYDNDGTGEFLVGNNIVGLGELDTTTSKYKITIKVLSEGFTDEYYNIYLALPLESGEYIDYEKSAVMNSDNSIKEQVELPQISISHSNSVISIEDANIEVSIEE